MEVEPVLARAVDAPLGKGLGDSSPLVIRVSAKMLDCAKERGRRVRGVGERRRRCLKGNLWGRDLRCQCLP